ncbi:MAG: hydrogenase iron-sulfur subunit [Deltaproteobacteria bacterium]|nr:hydrogenase iron-sulfur subunit [Deltaproteobacteria bacterium]
MSISDLEDRLHQSTTEDLIKHGNRVVFVCGWQQDSHPSIARRMLDSCFQLQQGTGVKTYFMTGNLKVSATGAEMRVHEAKRAGTVFLKFTDDFPTIEPQASGRFVFDYLDELTRTPFQFEADLIVVDETIGPARSLKALAQVLGIDQDDIGFAQSDNVRHMNHSTNRRGVFVAGGSRGILSEAEQLADADQVSLNVLGFLQDADADNLPKAVIQDGRCARCLTCFRICPHMAIDIGPRISVENAACRSCGLCVAACPAHAIEMEGVQISAEVKRRFEQPVAIDTPEKHPRIVVFGCSRSAGQAFASTHPTGPSLPEGVNFVELPCGGTIAGRHILAAFEAGAEGVMICTCHTDNCQSEVGNQVARKRTSLTRDLLTAAGLESDRLRIASIAANMGNELTSMIDAFVGDIGKLNLIPTH